VVVGSALAATIVVGVLGDGIVAVYRRQVRDAIPHLVVMSW
jgi:hypothetical protein